MIVKTQKKIKFINDCDATVDYNELENAIIWYARNPVVSTKHIYMHGNYPAVSIHKEKIHIHILLMMYWLDCMLPCNYFVHHIDGNKLNADQTNLSLMFASVHQSQHNKDKILSDNHRKKISENNRKRKGKRRNYTKPISAKQVYDLKIQGYSFNKISQILNLDWGCVKRRYNDYIHDNPNLCRIEHDSLCETETYKAGDEQ